MAPCPDGAPWVLLIFATIFLWIAQTVSFVTLSDASSSVSDSSLGAPPRLHNASINPGQGNVACTLRGRIDATRLIRLAESLPLVDLTDEALTGTVVLRPVEGGHPLTAQATADDGIFEFPEVQPGEHVLEIYHRLYHFPTVALTVSHLTGPSTLSVDAITGNILCDEIGVETAVLRIDAHGSVPGSIPSARVTGPPLKISAVAPYVFFQAPNKLSLLGFLKHPMLIIGGISMLLMFLMPMLQGSVDQGELRSLLGQPETPYQSPFVKSLQSPRRLDVAI